MQRRPHLSHGDQIAKSVAGYLDQLDSTIEKQMEALSDQQISLTDPDRDRWRPVDAAPAWSATIFRPHDTDEPDVVADRGDFNSVEVLACDQAGITVTLPKPSTSTTKAAGRSGKQDLRYAANEDVYICPAGNRLTCCYARYEEELNIRRYRTGLSGGCSMKAQCTPGKQRRVSRWEHEDVLEAVQQRLDENPQAMRQCQAMRQRREAVEHPLGMIKMRLSATHFLMKRLKSVRTKMALSVSVYNLTRVINLLGITPLIQAIQTQIASIKLIVRIWSQYRRFDGLEGRHETKNRPKPVKQPPSGK
ncbi:MAG: transposase [Geminicoccaceae bacterium]